MSKIRKVIKLYSDGKNKLFISSYLSLSRSSVKKYISLFEVLGLSFELIHEKTDAELGTSILAYCRRICESQITDFVRLFSGGGMGIKKNRSNNIVTQEILWTHYPPEPNCPRPFRSSE